MVARPPASPVAPEPRPSQVRQRRTVALSGDERGLSSLEYAVLFALLVVGGLSLWHGLASTASERVGSATNEFSSVLSGAQARERSDFANGASPATAGAVPPGARGRFSAPDNAATGSGTSPTDSHVLSVGQGAARAGQGVSHGGATSAASEVGASSEAREAPSLWDKAQNFVRDSASSQLALGIAAGAAGSVAWPLGFVPSPEGAGRNFEAGRAIGETATGLAQIYAGGAAIVGGTAGGAASLAAAVPSGGLGLAGLIPSATAIEAGIVLVGAGLVNAGRGIWRGYNAMQMADEPPGAGSASGGSGTAAPTGADPPSGGASSGSGPPEGPGRFSSVTRHPDAHSVARHGGAVTDDQLAVRARTGVAPDGHVVHYPNGGTCQHE